jgi:hypothetical protein
MLNFSVQDNNIPHIITLNPLAVLSAEPSADFHPLPSQRALPGAHTKKPDTAKASGFLLELTPFNG